MDIVIDEGLREWVSNATHYQGTENLTDNARTIAFLEGRFEDEFLPEHNADALRATMLATMRRIGLAQALINLLKNALESGSPPDQIELGVVSDEVFSVIIIMVILSTLITPMVLTRLLRSST